MLTYQFTNGTNSDFIALCDLLDLDLNEAVGGEKQREQYCQYNTLEKIHDVVIAYEDKIPVGCAAFKFYAEGIAEVKRVYVKKEFRKQGIAKRLMYYIEKIAKEKGFSKLILETGSTFKAAHSLYHGLSFEVISNYGQYQDLPDSICMEKNISTLNNTGLLKNEMLVYVGTYTKTKNQETIEKFQHMDQGIQVLRLNRDEKTLLYETTIANVENPSFLTVDSKKQYLYTVNELHDFEGEASGSLSAFSIDSTTGDLTFLNRKSTGGKDPCYITLSSDEKYVMVTNYSSGNACAYETLEDGLGKRTAFVQHEGSSVHPVRQSAPYAHSCKVIKDQPYIVVMDLGIDQLVVYELKEDGSFKLLEDSIFYCEKGSGPRHGEFHPSLDCFYVINELSSTVSVLKYHKETVRFELIQTISSIPTECDNTGADIHVTHDGRFLYASNRGHDSLAVYEINQMDGTLTLLRYAPCGGKTPRNFTIEPNDQFLLVANQNSNDVVMFEINQSNGELTEVSRVEVATPVCLCPVFM